MIGLETRGKRPRPGERGMAAAYVQLRLDHMFRLQRPTLVHSLLWGCSLRPDARNVPATPRPPRRYPARLLGADGPARVREDGRHIVSDDHDSDVLAAVYRHILAGVDPSTIWSLVDRTTVDVKILIDHLVATGQLSRVPSDGGTVLVQGKRQ